MSIVFIALVDPELKSPMDATTFAIRPLFRCNTLYHSTTIVAPVEGVFSRNVRGDVQLFSFGAPKTQEMIDREYFGNMAMTVGGLASAGVMGAAAFFPVTAPFLWGALGVGTTIGCVMGYNSASELLKRKRHEQDVSLMHKDARGHWLAIGGVALGFAAVAVGNASNVLSLGSLVVNGASVGNSIWDMYQSDRPVTAGKLAQISASLFFFTTSLFNFQTARAIVRNSQTEPLKNYKTLRTLSINAQKRVQIKLNERMRELGTSRGMDDRIDKSVSESNSGIGGIFSVFVNFAKMIWKLICILCLQF